MTRTKFTPRVGQIYTNQGGGTFLCTDSDEIHLPYNATMQNTASGWTLCAKGCGIYEDGTIDWDYSTNGRFEDIVKYQALGN